MTFAVMGWSMARASFAAELWHDRLRGVERIHMLHVGKTGGTALKAGLAEAHPERARLMLHGHCVSLSDVPAGESCFFFVRDPVSRFVSGFLSRQRQGRPRHDCPWTEAEREAFARFATANALALALSGPDEDRRRAGEAMAGITHVRDHYWRWLCDEPYLRKRWPDLLFVGSQERFDSDVAALSTLLKSPIVPPRDEVGAHRNPDHLNRHLDAEAIANLKAWYSADYACLRVLREKFPHLPDYDGGVADAALLR
jgi:hypothetical protein